MRITVRAPRWSASAPNPMRPTVAPMPYAVKASDAAARVMPRSREYGTMWTDTIRTTPPSRSQHASRNQSRRSPSAATIVTPRGSAFDAVAGLIGRRGGSRTTSVARPPTRQSQLPKTRKVLRQPSHSMSPAATGPAMMKLTLKPDSTRARTRLR